MTTYCTRLYLLLLTLSIIYSCKPELIDQENIAPIATFEEEAEMDKQSRMDLAMEQEFEMTVDPALGIIPRERLLAAKNAIRRAGNQNQRAAIPGINWTERGPNNVSGRTRDILIDAADPTGNTIYAGSVGGGLWKCENALSGNPTWTIVDDFFDNLAICAIAQDPNNNDIMYFGTGEGYYNGDAIAGLGLWKSTDGGVNWDYLNSTSGSTFNHSQQIIVNGIGTVLVATRSGGVQESTDGGDTWNKVLGTGADAITNRVADLEIASNGDLYAAMGIQNEDGIYKSTDDGMNWTKLTFGLPNTDYERIELACAPSNSSVVYALFQDSNDNDCKGIYKTLNGGTSWVAKNNPSAFGMSNFARNQAWYDLIATVDPNDSDRIFIGGVDLLVSDNGGNNWQQISQWYGGNGMQYVHADQHIIKFLPGDSDIAFFGNDGGLFASSNASANTPTIDFISNGFNVTQFYACAIHPEAETDYFLAGAQDNGTQQFTIPGLNNTNRVTGGDGAYCHIDQGNSQIQITTYVYNNYYISTNGGNSFSSRSFSNNGRFINPFAYDDTGNKLYAAYDDGSYLRWNNPATAGSNYDIVSVSAFNNSMISHVSVSPNVENRVYFGLDNGDLVRVDDANTGNAQSGTLLRNGIGYLSSMAIEEGNEDHMLITYSNYGVISIFETLDGGDSWGTVEGNLPDIPVRWVVFNPNNADEALIATEVGVWSTNDLDENATQWVSSNSGLANVRVDMLKTRSSDNLMIAATHGRGLFSTSRFSELFVGFDKQKTQILEFSNTGAEGDCELHFQELEIPVSISRLPLDNEDITLYFSVVDTSSATEDEDFILLTDSLDFTSLDTETVKYINVKVFDDAIEETGGETLILKTNINGVAGVGDSLHIVEIFDNDRNPLDITTDYTGGIGDGVVGTGNYTPLKGYWEDAKSQYLYRANELTAKGFGAGSIIELSFDIASLGSTQDYSGFTISMKETNVTSLGNNNFETDLITVYSGDFDPVEGWNTFVLTGDFTWDGESNLLIQTCFNNSTWTDDDIVRGSETGFTSVATRFLDNSVGCGLDAIGISGILRPNIQLRQIKEISIADQVDHKTSFIKENETAYFYDSEGDIILSVKNLEGGDLGCLDVRIDNYGLAQSFPDWLNGGAHGEKTFLITSDNDVPYELTLYFTEEELAVWDDPNALSILKTPGAILSHTGANYEVVDLVEVNVENFGVDNHYAFTTIFNSFSGFALTDADPISLPLNLLSLKARHVDFANQISWQTTNEENVNYMELQRSFDGRDFFPVQQVAARNNAPLTNDYEYLDEDLNKTGLTYYYRLKVVDMDESYKYSDVVSVFVEASEAQSKVYPNPFEETITIEPISAWDIKTVSINDAAGKELGFFLWDGRPIDLRDLSPGVFWLKLIYENGQTEVHRLVKTK